uniref:HsdM family class I SAM-dependent methyltransferase n=1 Tax=Vibrio anguillarum TaxID=55601 RepID=UPI001F2832B3
ATTVNLGVSSVRNDDMGRAYEYLIKRFADKANKKAGEFYTPRTIVRLMVNILDPQANESVYDPACGTGGVFVEAKKHAKDKSCFNGLSFIGNDLSPFAHLIGALNLLLNDIDIGGVSISDS